jgi:hypothetical protein
MSVDRTQSGVFSVPIKSRASELQTEPIATRLGRMTKIAARMARSRSSSEHGYARSAQLNPTAISGDDDQVALYFFHIPKTGGRTLIKHLEQRYGKNGVVNPSKNKSPVCDIFLQKKFIVPSNLGARHIVGHFASFSLMGGRESNYYKVCFWRHPAKWYLSFYNYRHHRNSDTIKRKFSFADFRRSMLRNPMTEALLLYCADVRGWSHFFMSDKHKFDLACATIERFDRFEDIAKVDNFLEFIGDENGHKPKDYNRAFKSENVLQHIDEATIVEIECQNPVDLLLHKIALGEETQAVRKEAASVLSRAFDPGDIVRALLVPYYRFKTWVVPFV